MTLYGDILGAYRGVGASMHKQLLYNTREEKVLMYVFLACFLFFVARVPALLNLAAITTDADKTAVNIIATNFASSMFYGPLMMYGIAAMSHLVAKLFQGGGTFLQARLALFWSALVVSPLVLLAVMLRVFVAGPEFVIITNVVTGIVFIYCWGICLSIAEKYRNAYLTTFSIVAVFGLIAALLRALIS